MGSTPRRYIAVAGNMGVGKSSLVKFLCSQYKLQPFYEPNEENPYLKDFYGDMRRWSFHLQIYFLSERFKAQVEISKSPLPFIQDRTIYEDAEIFAHNLYRCRKIARRDYETYQALYRSILRSLRPPDVMVYLKGNLRTIRKRIKARGRPEEQGVPVSYLRRLNGLYEEWFARYDHSPTLVLETDNMDYATDLLDRLDLLARIEQYM